MMLDATQLEVTRWVFIITLLPLGLYMIFVNWLIPIYYFITHKSLGSGFPFLGSILSAIGIALLPYHEVRRYWYIPFLVDHTWISLVLFIMFHRKWDKEYNENHPSQSDYRNDDNGVDDPSLTPSLPPNADIPTVLIPTTIIVNQGGAP